MQNTGKRYHKVRISDADRIFRAEQFNRYFLLWAAAQRSPKDNEGFIALRDVRAAVAEVLYKCGIIGQNVPVSLAGLSRGPRTKRHLEVTGTGTDMAWKLTPGFQRYIEHLGWLIQFERVAKAIDARTERSPVDNLQLLPTIQDIRSKEAAHNANLAATVRQEAAMAVNKAQAAAAEAETRAKHAEEVAARRVDEAEAAARKTAQTPSVHQNNGAAATPVPKTTTPAPAVAPAPVQPASDRQVGIATIQKFMAIVNEIGVDTAFDLLATLDSARKR